MTLLPPPMTVQPPPVLAVPSPPSVPTPNQGVQTIRLSLVCVVRNDDWGAMRPGGLIRRATLALSRMLHVADEGVLVDMNSPRNTTPLVMELPQKIQQSPRLRSVVVDAARCAELLRLAANSITHRQRSGTVAPQAGREVCSSGSDATPACRVWQRWHKQPLVTELLAYVLH